ncbi:SPX domain-containing membrane protein At4g22990-like isoform X3 [Diospyros lotus]|uniref:SPX domain-containing membrane protein At4g22990-like isoform X3 n=1 Tax=Diospyros lotus TaxID=55363 RepID=UPI00225351C7|nr:SPX domain-containing membrane protein At4g22990-like isoform X3 [Diospyros lotus]
MNAIGLRKILKKFDKRCGYKFTDYYVKTRANHPYSQLRQVFRHVGIAAVVGTISRNLADLQDHQGSHASIYDHPSLSVPDPIIDTIKAAVDRLTNSTNFLEYLGRHALIVPDDLQTPSQDNLLEEKYHFMSLLLNLVFSSVYFSAWSNKSYLRPLVFSSIVLFVGNALYALAYDMNSIYVLLIGRVFCGLGSARAVNRRYISDCVPHKMRMKASAGFVSASALGMACGPVLACLLQTRFTLFNITFNEDTLPGWLMALAWLVYLLWLWISFREPPLEEAKDNNIASHEANTAFPISGQVETGLLEDSISSPLLVRSEEKQEEEDREEECDCKEESPKENQKPITSIKSAFSLLTPSVKVQLFVYFMLKYAMEIVLAESSVVTAYYFIWSTTNVAVFLAFLGLTVLPINILVGSYLSNMFEERQVLLASEIMVCLGIILSFHVIIPYSVPQYVCSALITFVSAEVLEGVNLALLSRVMSSRLSRGTYNGGLLSTEAGTLARVIADGTITLAGYWGMSRLLNVTLIPCLFICISSIAATCLTYNSLY